MSSPTSQPDTIRTRPRPNCLLCGAAGEVLYSGLKDFCYHAAGEWTLKRCPAADCGLIWLDPVPTEEDIGKAYATYYTHNQPEPGARLLRDAVYGVWNSYLGMRFGYQQGTGPGWARLFAPLALLHPGGPDELDAAAMHLPAPQGKARVLDVGCGSGVTLARMKTLGWEVEGVEVDPGGVEAARARGVTVRQGSVQEQQYPDNSFDAIHSSHVLEHLHEPVRVLKECCRILKPGGALVFLTPNTASWGHRRFGRNWLHLDPPRHLVLFNPRALRKAAEQSGLKVQRVDSSVRIAWVSGALSYSIRATGRGEMSVLGQPAALARGMAYQLRERMQKLGDPDAGDELRLFATKAG
jgi:2-polyprenyl-3-methyl-5-hydroxy-6-metoxy-1,4-benzoquinol methylase